MVHRDYLTTVVSKRVLFAGETSLQRGHISTVSRKKTIAGVGNGGALFAITEDHPLLYSQPWTRSPASVPFHINRVQDRSGRVSFLMWLLCKKNFFFLFHSLV